MKKWALTRNHTNNTNEREKKNVIKNQNSWPNIADKNTCDYTPVTYILFSWNQDITFIVHSLLLFLLRTTNSHISYIHFHVWREALLIIRSNFENKQKNSEVGTRFHAILPNIWLFYQLLIKVERLQNFNADTEIQVNGEWAGNWTISRDTEKSTEPKWAAYLNYGWWISQKFVSDWSLSILLFNLIENYW